MTSLTWEETLLPQPSVTNVLFYRVRSVLFLLSFARNVAVRFYRVRSVLFFLSNSR